MCLCACVCFFLSGNWNELGLMDSIQLRLPLVAPCDNSQTGWPVTYLYQTVVSERLYWPLSIPQYNSQSTKLQRDSPSESSDIHAGGEHVCYLFVFQWFYHIYIIISIGVPVHSVLRVHSISASDIKLLHHSKDYHQASGKRKLWGEKVDGASTRGWSQRSRTLSGFTVYYLCVQTTLSVYLSIPLPPFPKTYLHVKTL